MEDNYSLLLKISFILLLVLLYVNFNIKVTKETFVSLEEAARNYNVNSSNKNSNIGTSGTQTVKSIRSLDTGLSFNVLSVEKNPPTETVVVKTKDNRAVSVNNNGTFGYAVPNIFEDKQKFKLVSNYSDREPYYTLVSEYMTNYQLVNEGQTIASRKASDSNNQKWKVLYETQPSSITKESEGSSGSKGIKINLTLNKNSLDQLLGVVIGDDSTSSKINMNSNFNKEEGLIDHSSCNLDKWIPKDAIRSLCPGCDSNMFN